jgi:hypothetical protein
MKKFTERLANAIGPVPGRKEQVLFYLITLIKCCPKLQLTITHVVSLELYFTT